jgi:hypothetical protein
LSQTEIARECSCHPHSEEISYLPKPSPKSCVPRASKMLSLKMRPLFVLSFSLSFFTGFSTADDCRPITWSSNARVAGSAEMTGTPMLSTPTVSHVANSRERITILEVKPGELNCRAWGRTYDDFFSLNPALKTNCSDIQPKSKYCIDGCMFLSLRDK